MLFLSLLSVQSSVAHTLSEIFHRYKIAMLVADADGANEENPVVAQFMFFGDVGQDLAGRPPMLLVAGARGQRNYVLSEIKGLIGRRYDNC